MSKSEKMDGKKFSYRPRGVTVLAIILLFFAVLSIIMGTIWGSGFTLSGFQYLLMNFLVNYYSLGMVFVYAGFPIDIVILYAFWMAYSAFQSGFIVNLMFYVGIDIFSILFIIASISLFYMKKWGYYLTLTLGVLLIIVGIIGLFYIVGVIPLVIGIVIVVYLAGNVKYEFE